MSGVPCVHISHPRTKNQRPKLTTLVGYHTSIIQRTERTSMILGSDRCICILLGFCCSILSLVTNDGSARYGTNFGSAESLAIMSGPNAFASGLLPPMPPIPPAVGGKWNKRVSAIPSNLTFRWIGAQRRRSVQKFKQVMPRESDVRSKAEQRRSSASCVATEHTNKLCLCHSILTGRGLACCLRFQNIVKATAQSRISR